MAADASYDGKGRAVISPLDNLPRRNSHMPCPHCGVPGIIRSSESVTEIAKTLWMECRIPECAHTWVAQIAYLYGLSPSGIPKDGLTLPMRPANRGKVLSAIADARAKAEADPTQPTFF